MQDARPRPPITCPTKPRPRPPWRRKTRLGSPCADDLRLHPSVLRVEHALAARRRARTRHGRWLACGGLQSASARADLLGQRKLDVVTVFAEGVRQVDLEDLAVTPPRLEPHCIKVRSRVANRVSGGARGAGAARPRLIEDLRAVGLVQADRGTRPVTYLNALAVDGLVRERGAAHTRHRKHTAPAVAPRAYSKRLTALSFTMPHLLQPSMVIAFTLPLIWTVRARKPASWR